MTVEPAHAPELGRSGAWRLVVTWVLLFAFALQSHATQTHVHRAPAAAECAPIVQLVGKNFALSASSVDDEAIACPLCQAIATAGAFYSPSAIALAPLAVQAQAAVLPPILAGLALAPAGFSWRSRAPPQP